MWARGRGEAGSSWRMQLGECGHRLPLLCARGAAMSSCGSHVFTVEQAGLTGQARACNGALATVSACAVMGAGPEAGPQRSCCSHPPASTHPAPIGVRWRLLLLLCR